MKALSQPLAIKPSILLLILLAAGAVFIGATSTRDPLPFDFQLELLFVVALGLVISMLGGIGHAALTSEWWHPLSITGEVLGALILFVMLAVFAGWKLPLIRGQRQALLVIGAMTALKIAIAVIRDLLGRA